MGSVSFKEKSDILSYLLMRQDRKLPLYLSGQNKFERQFSSSISQFLKRLAYLSPPYGSCKFCLKVEGYVSKSTLIFLMKGKEI